MKLSEWRAVEEMIERGFRLECSQHTYGVRGYFAKFIDTTVVCRTCEDCDDGSDDGCNDCSIKLNGSWAGSAHHLTLSGAIKMAIKMANGERVSIPDSENFECEAR